MEYRVAVAVVCTRATANEEPFAEAWFPWRSEAAPALEKKSPWQTQGENNGRAQT
jgi:hypothetical protein